MNEALVKTQAERDADTITKWVAKFPKRGTDVLIHFRNQWGDLRYIAALDVWENRD